MIRHLRHLVATIFVVLIASAATSAQTLYLATGGSTNSNLYIINPANGAVISTVGPIGFAITGMAVHPVTGVLYGSTSGNSPSNPRSLITINKTTGAGTLVGQMSALGPVADITFTPDGTLYGWLEPGQDDLVTINLTTGLATVVGNSGLSTFGSGIASDASGTLYFAGDGANQELRTVNRTTGLTTVVATMSGSPQPSDAIPALAFQPGTGVLFGLDGLDGNPNVSLITINTTTGVVTNRGATVTNADAIAFDGSAPPPPVTFVSVPTLSDFALLALALAVATLGFVAYKRR